MGSSIPSIPKRKGLVTQMNTAKNPFDLVKANDLSDGEIAEYFVDLPGGASFIDRVKPTSPMPMFILGGKGSGKTHLMRYLSVSLKSRNFGQGPPLRTGIENEGYLGTYIRCSGLNAHRFSGKKQSKEKWQTVFSYYFDLWISQLFLSSIHTVFEDDLSLIPKEFYSEASKLFDIQPDEPITTLFDLIQYLENLQREADISINNAGMQHQLNLLIRTTPGKIVFGLPQIASKLLPCMSKVRFIYLIDEFENLTDVQQCYINTLIRERKDPTGFKIGVRLYGFRSKATLCAGEENRQDSEYEVLRLDSELREQKEEAQLEFATNLIKRRLHQSGYISHDRLLNLELESVFEEGDQSQLLEKDSVPIRKLYTKKKPPYIENLNKKLFEGMKSNCSFGVRTAKDIEEIMESIRTPDTPFLERINIFLLYRAWSKKKNLLEAAKTIASEGQKFATGDNSSEHAKVMKHFKNDLVAQFYRETRRPLKQYLGFSTFVKMSGGLPRVLLSLMKNIYTWSIYLGEKPFLEGKISIEAQTEGVNQSAEWFFTEARAPGSIGPQIRDAMIRLGQLLRDIRFSDKPSECSISCFSVDPTSVSETASGLLKEAVNWSMLIQVPGGQHDRNKPGRVDDKYQLHPMLAPRWDLSVARRGAVALSGEEANAILTPSDASAYDEIVKKRLGPMLAPYFRQSADASNSAESLFADLADE